MSHRGPAPHEKGPAAKGMVAGRPSSRGSASLSQCGHRCVTTRASSGNSRRGSSTSGLDRNGELPDRGVAPASYGRDSAASVRQLGSPGTKGNRGGRMASEDRIQNEFSVDNASPWLPRYGGPGKDISSVEAQRYVSFDASESVHCFDQSSGASTAYELGDSPGRLAEIGYVGMSKWTCSMVQNWLIDLGLESVVSNFAREAIDGEALLECREEDLIALGVERLGDRKKVMKQIRLKQVAEADPDTCIPSHHHDLHNVAHQPHLSHGSQEDVYRNDTQYEIQREEVGLKEVVSDMAHDNFASRDRDRNSTNPLGDAAPPDPNSNEASCDNPLVPTNRYRFHGDQGKRRDTRESKGKGGHGKGDGKNCNFTSFDNPLAAGNFWGEVRGLPERPPVFGNISERTTWRDDPGPRG